VNESRLSLIAKMLSDEKQKLTNILPQHLQDDFARESFLSGGCIYSLYNHDEPKDYDFFIQSQEFVDKLRAFFIGLLSIDDKLEITEDSNRIKITYYNGCRIVITKNALSFDKKYQIITKFVGTPKEVVTEFDFRHNMFYHYDNKINTLSDFDHLDSNKLVYNELRARDISGTIIRVHKFIERGMTITNAEMSKMLKKLREIGFTKREDEIIDGAGSY
jgi:hypothetical protein